MEEQKLLDLHHDPPLCYHRWKKMRLEVGETNTVLNFRILGPCAEWWEGTVRCNSHDYLPFCNTVVLEGGLEASHSIDGNSPGYYGRKQAEQAIRESEKRYRRRCGVPARPRLSLLPVRLNILWRETFRGRNMCDKVSPRTP